jgi:hypothetical protein
MIIECEIVPRRPTVIVKRVIHVKIDGLVLERSVIR